MKIMDLALLVSSAAILVAAGPLPATAQPWPSQTVKIVTPFPPGSGGDVTVRPYADSLAKRWRQPVIVENRSGADGILAVSAVTGSSDGHTLLYINGGPLTSNLILHAGNLPYDPARDVVPISMGAEAFVAIGVPSSLAVNSLAELVEFARTRPGQLNWGATPGTLDYLIPAFLKQERIDLERVRYRDVASAMQDLSQGRLHLYVAAVATQLPMVQAGKIKLLAITNGERAPGLDHVPTVEQAGFPGLRFDAFLGFFGPRSVPDQLRARISADIRAAAQDERLAQRFSAISMKVRASTPEELERIVADERATLKRITAPEMPAR